jgi:hypothetical protein
MLRKRPDWKRPLPRPLFLPQIKTTLTTLGDVRAFLKRLPAQFRDRETWQVVARNLDSAAAGSDIDDLSASLRLVFMLERAECRPR